MCGGAITIKRQIQPIPLGKFGGSESAKLHIDYAVVGLDKSARRFIVINITIELNQLGLVALPYQSIMCSPGPRSLLS